ncbi:single-stranded DNA-binding protein [Streptosporangium canum]|uniref:single-stranded DNA-binding protein n=1 Tax=Streptosporangium canum TaxID=324952 RepID=UPI00379FC6FB
MAAGDTTITIVGNLVDDPELRFTPTGQAVARFRIASTPRFLDKTTNEWKDGEGLFLTCNVWRQAAENVAESLQRGMRVIVQGRLRQRSYETKEGEKRTVYEVEVDEVGPSLKNATAKVNKTARQGGGGGGFGGGPANDPWASAAPAAPQGGGFGGGNNYGGGGGGGGGGNFGGGQQQGGGNFGGGDFSDEPPF